ncbi:MAG: hypothetical protein ACI9U2_003985, partial [Bradymonadia bacterium]
RGGFGIGGDTKDPPAVSAVWRMGIAAERRVLATQYANGNPSEMARLRVRRLRVRRNPPAERVGYSSRPLRSASARPVFEA